MRFFAVLMPLYTLLVGIGGYFIRKMELVNVLDTPSISTGNVAPISLLLIVVTVLFLLSVILFACQTSKKHKVIEGFVNSFGTDSVLYPLSFIMIGLVWLIGTAMHYFDLTATNSLQTGDVYLVVLSALASVCIAFFAIAVFEDPRNRFPYALNLVPVVFTCFWLITLYSKNAANPIILSYVYQCLAIVASALGFFFTSGFLYKKSVLARAIIAYSAAIYFCCVSLADNLATGIPVIFCAMIAVNTTHLSVFLWRLRRR